LDAIARVVSEAAFDLIVTVGGASVGDHDLVKPALATLGLDLRVETIAVRPGKPTWFGTLDETAAACWACPATRPRPWSAPSCSCARCWPP
jgi:molybdopterin molybdotransferase